MIILQKHFFFNHTIMNRLLLFLLSFTAIGFACAAESRWQMKPDGSIIWRVNANLPHEDHIEMSGRQVSVVFRYGVSAERRLILDKSMVWPMLRTIPNDTHASLIRHFEWDPIREIVAHNFRLDDETVDSISLNGMMRVWSHFPATGFRLLREYFPSTDKPALIENYTLTNGNKGEGFSMELPDMKAVYNTNASEGVNGSYTLVCKVDGKGSHSVNPGESLSFSASIQAYSTGKNEKELSFDGTAEHNQRRNLVDKLENNLVLETPDETINRMFAFSKIRASESIYQTAGGPMHGPGGESYYAAIWANDQAEYVSPFFPYEGYDYGNASALNCYKIYSRYMNKKWKPIPSSVIAEGKDIWDGAGDRGDAAMIAYGASRYALARASKKEAEELWPLIKWCLEYCNRKINAEGVVESNSDELEGRFPSGKANLCTSSLYYDALISASCLCKELGEPSKMGKNYLAEASKLRKCIESYFGATMDGFHTYRYYKENDILRSWICIPLCMGITERAEGTIQALFSPKLWTKDGLLTQAGSKTFWDRSTLYALRGVFAAGYADKAAEYLEYYSKTRLLGEHVPYAIEAWPEGGQRHLSAESGLYARIITEGLFGIRPTGFRSFSLKPEPPTAWNRMALRHVRAFGADFDISVVRQGKKLNVTLTSEGKTKKYTTAEGETIHVKL